MFRVIFLGIALLFFNSLFGQSKGQISGEIVDKRTRQPIIGANIMVEGTAVGAATDENGHFVILNLEPGSYNLSVHYLGYKPILRSNVIVNPKRTTVLKLEMEEDILRGEMVEVTGSYFEKPTESVVSTRTMDFEEIRRSPGSILDIQRVMQALPAVVSGTDQNNEIIIRGGIPGENLFLMDDIEIPNPNHFGEQGAGGGPINMLNTYMVEKVDFYAGAFSAKYGDKASSVMDITLREGSRDRFRGELQMGMAGAGLLVEGPVFNNNTSFILSARKSFLDLIISSTGLTAVPRYHNFQGKMTVDLSKRNSLIINGIYGSDRINIENEGTGGYSRGAENVDYAGQQYATGITLRTLWSESMFSKLTLSSTGNIWEIDVYRTHTGRTYFLNKSNEYEHTFKSDFTYQLSKNLELNWGTLLKRVEFDHHLWAKGDTLYLYLDDDPWPDKIFRIYSDWLDRKHEHSYKTGLYLQMVADLWNKIRFTAGLRHDYFDYNRFQSFSPRLGLSFFLNHKTNLNMAYGIHYQSPAYVELTAHPANQNLESKFTCQYVVGVEHLFREDIKVTVEGYYKTYHNVPYLRSLTTPDPFDSFEGERLNMGRGYARGIEFFLQKKLTRHFSTIVSYSHSVSRAHDPRFNTEYNWDYDYRNVFTFIGGYKSRLNKSAWYQKMKSNLFYQIFAWLLPFGDEIEFSFRFRYLGGRPYTPPVYHPELRRWLVEESQPLNTRRYPEYHRLDFRMDRRFIFKNLNLVVYFDMMNVYNRSNIWEYQYNDDGTREEILQFEVFPVGGVSLEF